MYFLSFSLASTQINSLLRCIFYQKGVWPTQRWEGSVHSWPFHSSKTCWSFRRHEETWANFTMWKKGDETEMRIESMVRQWAADSDIFLNTTRSPYFPRPFIFSIFFNRRFDRSSLFPLSPSHPLLLTRIVYFLWERTIKKLRLKKRCESSSPLLKYSLSLSLPIYSSSHLCERALSVLSNFFAAFSRAFGTVFKSSWRSPKVY